MSEVTTAVKHGEDDVTEIVEADFSKVAGVGRPANRVPYVLLKAAGKTDGPDSDADDPHAAPVTPFGQNAGGRLSDEDREKFRQNAEAVREGKDPAAKADAEPHQMDTTSREVDEQEDEMTKAAKAAHEEGAFCGDSDCARCVLKDGESYRLRSGVAPMTQAARQSRAWWDQVIKRKMDPDVGGGVDRDKIPDEDFAGRDRSFPIVTPDDVSDAAISIGRAGAKNFGPKELRAHIVAIAQRKGARFVAELPKKWRAEMAKSQVQEALDGTRTPEYVGTIDGSKQSIQPATTGLRRDLGSVIPSDQMPSSIPGVVARLRGGESAYEIPAVATAYTISNIEPRSPQIAMDATKAMAVSSLVEAMDAIAVQREAQKAGAYLQVPGPYAGPSAGASETPGSLPWETYDAATLDQVALVLAQCVNAVENICLREQIEALSNDPSDEQDAWALQQAQDCLDCAAGIVARLAYAEAAEAAAVAKSGDVLKAYPRLRAADERALRSAHTALATVLAEHDRARRKGADVKAGSHDPSEGDKIQMELTKEELAEQIAASTRMVVKESRKADAKRAAKAAKAAKAAARKTERKLKKSAAKSIGRQLRVAKNANNGGDISGKEMEDQITGTHDADDIAMVGGKPQSKYEVKSMKKALKRAAKKQALSEVKSQLKALSAETQTVGQLVKSFADRPRSGGPIIDGIPRGGLFAATEQRLGGGRDASDKAIKSLEERLEKSVDQQARQQIGFELTKMRLAKEASGSFGDFQAYGR